MKARITNAQCKICGDIFDEFEIMEIEKEYVMEIRCKGCGAISEVSIKFKFLRRKI